PARNRVLAPNRDWQAPAGMPQGRARAVVQPADRPRSPTSQSPTGPTLTIARPLNVRWCPIRFLKTYRALFEIKDLFYQRARGMSASTRSVLDDELLAEPLRQPLVDAWVKELMGTRC